MRKADHFNDSAYLLQQLKLGSQTAFDALFRMLHPTLCLFAKRLVGGLPKGQAEEIVQDAFLKLWQRRADFSELSAVKGFLYIATRNACLNSIEKESVRHRKHAQYVYTIDEVEDTVVEEMIYAEVLRKVAQAIETLPEQCRRIINMAYEEGLTSKEIAQVLNITVSTVNNQKSRGISLLRKRLSNEALSFLLFFL